jgi:hypothetical protein
VVNALGPLLSDAVDQHKSLVQNTPLDGWVRDSKISFVYRDKNILILIHIAGR